MILPWNAVGAGGINGVVYSLATYDSMLYAGGPNFNSAGGIPVNQIAAWDGITWTAVSSEVSLNGLNTGGIYAMKEYNNELYAGGEFAVMDGDSIKGIARYNGLNWSSVGTGVDSTLIIADTLFDTPSPGDTSFQYAFHTVHAIAEFNNELYVGGMFHMIGGVAVNNVAKWTVTTDINEFHLSKSLSAFPNPTADKIFIDGSVSNGFYKLYNSSCNLVLQGKVDKEIFELHLKSLNTGIFFLTVGDENSVEHVKIIRH